MVRAPARDTSCGTRDAVLEHMPHIPRSYDQIVRSTVPNPDSSIRPTVEQEREAQNGFRAMDDHERELHARVIDALEEALRTSNERWSFSIEITRDAVTLSGHVVDARMRSRIERTVEAVQGVVEVRNQLTIAR